MRITVEIEDRLTRKGMRRGGIGPKKAAVESGLRLLIQTRA
jgi:Arc/MetJ family transcription regulator